VLSVVTGNQLLRLLYLKGKKVLDKINGWIDQTLEDYSNERVSCECFSFQFKGFYSSEFLEKSYFIVVNQIPMPDFPELRQAGFGSFIDTDFCGITYKNTYFIKKGQENNLALHFHELVHVLQWQNLGVLVFINRYMEEILKFGYEDAPLEKMAYKLEEHFTKRNASFSISNYVQQKI
jgi:hypothetical protein